MPNKIKYDIHERIFWLKLIGALNKTKFKRAQELKREGSEIVAIVSSIINKANKKGIGR